MRTGPNGAGPTGLEMDEPRLDIAPWSSPYIFPDELASSVVTATAPAAPVIEPARIEPRIAPATLFRPAFTPGPAQRASGLVAAIDGWATGRGTAALRVGAAVLMVAVAVIGWSLFIRIDGPMASAAIYTAPTLVLRAAVAGQILSLDVKAGDLVQPETALMTLRVSPGSSLPVKTPSDLVIRARVRGVVRGMDQPAGSDVAAGTPIARLADCDRAFLAVQRGPAEAAVPLPARVAQPAAGSGDAGAGLRAGQRVRVQIVGQAAFAGSLRDASGAGEPPGSLVVDPDTATAAACPLGAAATVTVERR